jgi:Protein of unknown function (DUF2800)
VISGSSLARNCRHDKDVLDKIPPRTAAEKTREANKRASAEKGTAGHKLFETWCLGQVSQNEDPELQGYLDLLAYQWRTPPTFEAELMWGLGAGGNYVEVVEVEPHVYSPKDAPQSNALLAAGRADGAWVSGDEMHVIDFKFGKWPVDPARTNLQVNAAGMALALRSFCKAYVPGIYYARDGRFDWGDPVEVASKEWRAMFEEVRAAALLDSEPHPGEVCGKCWSRSKCPVAQVTP